MKKKVLKMLGWGLLSLVAIAVVVVAIFCYKSYFSMDNYYWDDNISEHVELHESYTDYNHAIYNTDTRKYTMRNIDWVSKKSDSCNLAVFCRNGMRGYFDVNSGEPVVKEQYNHAWVFSEGVAAVVKDGKLGFINERNETVLPFRYDMTHFDHFECLFHNGYCLMLGDNGLYGFINKDGDWVVEPRYSSVSTYDDNYYIVWYDDKSGLIDRSLNQIFPVEYDGILVSYDAGIYLIKDGYMQCVDSVGNVIYPFAYDYSNYLYYQPSNNQGEYESAIISDVYMSFGINGKVGVVRRDNGKVIIPAIYDDVDMVSEMLFEVQTENFEILIDAHGNILDGR